MKLESSNISIEVAKPEHLIGVEQLVRSAITLPYDHPTLTSEQREETSRLASSAHEILLDAVNDSKRFVFVAKELDKERVVGFVVIDVPNQEWAELYWMLVEPSFQGKGVAHKLMIRALSCVSKSSIIICGVIPFNIRAIRFYRKYEFIKTSCIVGEHLIPRHLMVKAPDRN